MYVVSPADHTPPVAINVGVAPGFADRTSVGIAAGFMASLNTTVSVNVPTPAVASAISVGLASTLTTVGATVSTTKVVAAL